MDNVIKTKLNEFIEPYCGLMDHLLSERVLSRDDVERVNLEKTLREKNDKLLSFILSRYDWNQLTHSLCNTGQEHVASFFNGRGGW